MEVKYLRTREEKFVWKATPILLERTDLYPCNKDGSFLTTNEFVLPEPVPGPRGPADDKPKEAERTEVDDRKDSMINALLARAKELGIKNAHAMKEETLVARIAKAEEKLNK